jgi:hypothetical protein
VEKVLSLKVETPGARAFFTENLEALKSSGGDPALISAMTTVLKRPAWRYRYRTAIKNIIASSQVLTRLALKVRNTRK